MNETNIPIKGIDVVHDDIKGMQIMVLNVLLYDGQRFLAIMTQSIIVCGSFYFILSILQIFNLPVDFGVSDNSDDAVYYAVDGMTAEQEILLNLFIPVLLLFITAFIAMARLMVSSPLVEMVEVDDSSDHDMTSSFNPLLPPSTHSHSRYLALGAKRALNSLLCCLNSKCPQ